ncbi:MAG: TetR/AcrR family transcriptional regulator [Anaerolineae bacterium]|jgi:AcrR family transcriptional regulator|nr:TetR/AcrR family transcriptional regulator [Anaerolineae bacterium]MBT7783789.1 TetR/AcrR family transcriptional regulator [Anaerolineae bacterium]
MSPTTKEQTRQHILEKATHLFQTQGYARTTTQEIATQASVAEVTLFRHFGNKQKLFQAVAQQLSDSVMTPIIKSQLSGDYHTDLLLIGQHVLPGLIAQRETIRLLMFEASHFPEVQEAVTKSPRELRQMLSIYFQGQIEERKVQNLNPEVMAHAFFSMLFGYAVGLDTLTEPLSPDISLNEIVEQFIRIFVNGTTNSKNE